MNIALIGCGYVADFYMTTLAAHPALKVVAAVDIVPAQAARFHGHWHIPVFHHCDELLADTGVQFDMVLNLTNPDAHYAVSKQFLQAGKHVYSEKPMAMNFDDAKELVDLAAELGLSLGSAPCNHLGEAAQSIKRALDAGKIGKPLLAYFEMDDSLLALVPYRNWRSVSGAVWPAEDEFEVGCTLEHAGYCLTWLLLFFGPVKRVVSFQSLQYPGKPIFHGTEAADFSVAVLEFESGVVARMTCSLVAKLDHSLRIVGDEGALYSKDCWFYRTPTFYRRYLRIRNRFMESPWKSRLAMRPTGPEIAKLGASTMDYARGPREMALAIEEKRRSRIPADFSLHVNEVSLAIHHGNPDQASYRMRSTFAPLALIDTPIV